MSVSPLRNLSRGLLNPLGGEEPANVFRRDQRIDSFETILEPLAAPKEGDDPEPATFTAARGKEKAGDIDGAFLAWGRAYRDQDSPPAMRALAAVSAGRLALSQDRLASAEFWCLSAELLAPDVPATQRLRLSLAAERKESDLVIELTERLLKRSPNDLALLRTRAQALLDDAEPTEACKVAAQAYALGEADPKLSQDARLRNVRIYAFALTKDNRADEAVEVLEKALAWAPDDVSLHARIAEYVAPDWKNQALREQVRPLFEAANQAYQRGDGREVQRQAKQILALDPKDGLAHCLYTIGHDLTAFQKKALAAPLSTPEQTRALVQKLEEVLGQAQLKAGPGRPVDMFPEWPILTQLQRATVAYSILGYAKLLPALLEKGAKVRFPPPGTSCADPQIDPYADITKKKAFGRMSYVGRGWAYHTKAYVVCGLEHLEDAARGGRNTLTHEMAHLVHFHLRDLFDAHQEQALDPEQLTLANYFPRVEVLYQEAMKKEAGQQLLDAYSGTNVWEYFAQGMMGYLAMTDRLKESGPRLYTRNPHLFALAEELSARLSEYPAIAPGPKPPAAGLTDSGSATLIYELSQNARSRHVRTLAQGLWGRLLPLFDGHDPRPWPERSKEVRALLSRSRELSLIDKQEAPRSLLREANLVVRGMGPAELESQLLLMLENDEKRAVLLPIYQRFKAGPEALEDARQALIKVA
ncbi:MAG: hypothetical protein IPG45_02570 [Deltaproteobacteria bacterium]|jgi:tetratricopeptide (TPR) repeat protein|nr:hypothetical protein [Deltaproteobacteria bacterium]